MTTPARQLLDMVPGPPGWQLDWDALDATHDWVRALRGCVQSPVWHAEGDVWIHTRMVLEALLDMPAWRALPAGERQIVFLAALLHDVAKPACTRVEPDGHVSARGHSSRGSIQAREILWRLGLPFAMREHVAALVAHHQVPFFLVDEPDAEHRAIGLSHELRCDLLALVTEADARGRVCPDQTRLLDNIALYAEHCRELGCWREPWAFASDHARFLYFRSVARGAPRSPHAPAHDDTRVEVTILSGLPGAGKDHWIAAHGRGQAVVSLDAIRAQLNVDPAGSQGAVIREAYARARQHLRGAEPFIWNATNLSRSLRQRVIDLAADYGARVRVVYIEVPAGRLEAQNRQRSHPVSARVPARVIERLLRRWTVPTRREAHELVLAVDEAEHGL